MVLALPLPKSLLLFMVVVLFTGCGAAEQAPLDRSDENVNSAKIALTGEVTFKNEAGVVAFKIKPRDDGAKLFNAAGEEMARFTYSEGAGETTKIKIKDATDKVLGFVSVSLNRYKIVDADQADQFEFQSDDGRDWKFKTADEKLVFRVKSRDYGFEIETGDKVTHAKIKVKGNKVSLRDSAEETILSTKDSLPALAMVPFGFDVLDSLPIQSAIAFAIVRDLQQ